MLIDRKIVIRGPEFEPTEELQILLRNIISDLMLTLLEELNDDKTILARHSVTAVLQLIISNIIINFIDLILIDNNFNSAHRLKIVEKFMNMLNDYVIDDWKALEANSADESQIN